jgi:hypothetical protein
MHMHQHFYDAECLVLKPQLRRVDRSTNPAAWKQLERRYHSLVRSKKRAFQLDRLKNLLSEQRKNPRLSTIRTMQSDLPVSMQNVQSWDAFLAIVANIGSPAGCHYQLMPFHSKMLLKLRC